jgi:thiol:disulfide interchange protein DsbD
MQNPTFVACIYLLLVTIALNLFGVFEFGSSIQRASGKLAGNEQGYTGSFFSGILTTALATPCTAPFLGTAVAYAFSTSALGVCMVFTAIALGLALPYVLLSCYPAALKALPRPGSWMELFKQAMGFPILLTALWLLWVLEKQAGAAVVFSLLLSSTILAIAVWIFGITSRPQMTRRLRHSGLLVSILGVSAAILLSVPVVPNLQATAADATSTDQFGLHWQEFSEQDLQEAIAAGKPVYVDFTALWCVTCQVNKKLVFGSEEVRTLIAEKNVVLMRADWTRYNPAITAVLKQFGKAGVPLNLLYKPNLASPVVFPSLLSPSIVLEELQTI